MFSIHDRPTKLCDGMSRRELLRIGGLGVGALSLPSLLRAREANAPGILPTDKTFGRAKNVIFLYLAGGPPQHETFDPKPNAPSEIRGVFQPISTNIPGIQFGELLPRTARIADKLAVVRSMATNDNTHSSSSHWVLTGFKYQGPNPRTLQPTDWPYFGSVVKRYKPSDVLPPLSTVWIPDMMRLNENVMPAGQTGGLMGSQWDPDRFIGDPSLPDYEVEGLQLTDLPPMRLAQRQTLLKQLEEHFSRLERGRAVKLHETYQQQAYDLLTSGKAREAFAIQKEPDSIRDRYGRNKWGQCVLLARRLVEAGVRLVHVQWPREAGDNAVDNPLWDTHAQNHDRLEDVLCPIFDVGFTALVEDLEQRGLLDETLVVAIGEFGRTPKINAKAGRDHWGSVFSFAMAGAGISGGQVYGQSDKQGGHPISGRVEPGNLTATIFHLLGIDWQRTFTDSEGRARAFTERRPIYNLLGTEPATHERIVSSGDVSRVPVFDPSRLLGDTSFAGSEILKPAASPSRPKGWRITLAATDDRFGVRLIERDESRRILPDQHVAIGFNLQTGESRPTVSKGAMALLAQEVRSPFAGTFEFKVRAVGDASSQKFFEETFLKHFTCKLSFFEFTDAAKQVTARKELASIPFVPSFANPEKPGTEAFVLSKTFSNPTPGGNFSFGLGLGVAISVEKSSDGELQFAERSAGHAMIRIQEVSLRFIGKEVNKDVKV